jgi:hypothetical protein
VHGFPLLTLALQMHEHMGHDMAMPDPVSLFNHHLAGVLVILLGIFAYLEQTELAERRWVRYLWPLSPIILGVFLLIYSDNPQFWPFQLSRWARHWTAWQHKIFATVAILLGLIELLRRTGRLQHPAWKQVLNLLMVGAGVFLLFHKGHHAHIVHIEHIWMGTVAVVLSLAKIVADLGLGGRWLGLYAVPGLMVALGLQLALYVE